ncbi:Pre-rRNA-processing protein crb3/ipi3 [Diplogelasinospora grovesii]|uniref:Pre-rRNA-processing protein IPI3 n=1 Tax=Diplogelasinospora grovesii TaxID=303347 RepID=A0AAN6S5G4_9PEZI|nr:Pre-rRNA-processing protein crb3/ipi3 [Diplogelasinospora grovesii]
MLSEEFVSAVCGAPLTSNTAIAKDIGIYCHNLSPVYSVKSTFKKSSAPVNCLAASETHVFAAQHEKAYVHVYSRARGNQEAFVAFPERIRCLTLADDVLILGTAEGRLMLWETCTGRLISTPPRHVQAVSCVAATPYHVLTGSDDSDVHVWSLSHLLELGSESEHEPERTLSNHRAAITALSANASANPETNLCVSASKDKSCIIWNYQTGDALRTLLFPSFPLCISLDPSTRALFVSSDDGSLYLTELFAEKALLGPRSEDAATVVQVSSPFGATQPDTGPASCLGLSYDGTTLLTGHPRGQILKWDVVDNKTPVELANLNAAVSNLVFISPLPSKKRTKVLTIVKPSQANQNYKFTTQFETESGFEARLDSRFELLLNSAGFPGDALASQIETMQESTAGNAEARQQPEPSKETDELWTIIHEQRALLKHTMDRYVEAKPIR